MTEVLDSLYKIGPLLTFASALVAAGIAWNFGRVQAQIAKGQAETAASAARTARNKLRLELFEKRLEIYNVVTAHMDESHMRDVWKVDTSPYLRAVSGAKWLFDGEVNAWIYTELANVVLAVRMAQADCEGVEPGPAKVQKLMVVQAALKELNAQYMRRDAVFAPFLHLTDE